MKPHNLIKQSNSKGQLAKAIIAYQRALLYYAKEENWAVQTGNDELLHAIGNLAEAEGEAWRLAHAELMDAYQAAIEMDSYIVWLGDDDPTYVAEVVLGKRKPKLHNVFTPMIENQEQSVREPDNIDSPPTSVMVSGDVIVKLLDETHAKKEN